MVCNQDAANVGYQPLTVSGGGARINLENAAFEVLDAMNGDSKVHVLPLIRCKPGMWNTAGQEDRLNALISSLRLKSPAPLTTYELENGDVIHSLVGPLRHHDHLSKRVREPKYLTQSEARVASSQSHRIDRATWRSAAHFPGGTHGGSSMAEQLREVTGVQWRRGQAPSFKFESADDLHTAISRSWPNAAARFSSTIGRPGGGDDSCGISEGIHVERARDPIALGKGVVGAFEIGRPQGNELLLWKLCPNYQPETVYFYDNIHVVGPEGVKSFGPVYGQSLFNTFAQERLEGLSLGDVGVWWFGDDLLLATNKVTRSVELINWSARRSVRAWQQWPGTARLSDVLIDPGGRLLLQIDGDGSFFVHRIADGAVLLRGRLVDDEVVVWTDDALYDASSEGAHLVNVRLPGRPGTYSFHQFERMLRVPGLGRKALAGQPLPKLDVRTPPLLEGSVEHSDGGRVRGKVTIDAPNGPRALFVYQDGVLTDRIEPIADQRNVPFDVARLPGTRWTTLLAIDGQGLASQPMGRDLGPPPLPSRLSMVAIGVNTYKDVGLTPLHVAAADARELVDAATKSASAAGRSVGKLKPLVNDAATRSAVIAAVGEVTSSAEAGETLVLSFSGHGIRDGKGRFYLASHDTVLSDLEGTAISWADLANSFRSFKGRIVVLLDACHSGMAGTQFFASNDDVATQAMAVLPSNVVLFAASKGREFSYESPSVGGGLFSLAVADVIAGQRAEHDLDKNGMIEISELLRGVKQKVIVDGRSVREAVAAQKGSSEVGTQTPWVARNLMVGDFSLF